MVNALATANATTDLPDFMDFGCSRGGSIAYAMKHFGGLRGLGIDVDPLKVAKTRERGFKAEVMDILSLPDSKQVRFVTLMHFLEHLEGFDQAKAMLRKACMVSSEFVFVAQPYFDADGWLAEKGLKLYWSDWRGHPNAMSTLQLARALEDFRSRGLVKGYKIGWHARISDSGDRALIPLGAPQDQHDYDPNLHGPKLRVRFPFPVYRELRAIVDTGCSDRTLLERQARLGDVVISCGWPESLPVVSRLGARIQSIAGRMLRR